MCKKLARIGFGTFAALFIVAALLQLNDDQSALWVFIYLGAATVNAAGAANRPPPIPALAVFGVSFGGYAAALAYAIATGDATPMFEGQHSGTPGFFELEEGREFGGLVIILLTVVGLGAQRWIRDDREGPDNSRPESN